LISHTDIGAEALKLSDEIDSGLVRLWRSAGAASTRAALAGHIAVAASLDVIVRNIAAVRGLVPKIVAVDIGASSLAADLDVGALLVDLLDRVASAWAAATVDVVAGNGIGAGGSKEGGNGGEDGELHFGDWRMELALE